MPTPSGTKEQPVNPIASIAHADRLMKDRRIDEAIVLYEAHLDIYPNDLTVLLKTGICHLLNRSEKRFLKIYLQAKEMTSAVSELPAEARALWRKYEGLAFKLTAGALVLGGVAVAGGACLADSSGDPADSAPTVSAPENTVKPPTPRPSSSHKYGAGLFDGAPIFDDGASYRK